MAEDYAGRPEPAVVYGFGFGRLWTLADRRPVQLEQWRPRNWHGVEWHQIKRNTMKGLALLSLVFWVLALIANCGPTVILSDSRHRA